MGWLRDRKHGEDAQVHAGRASAYRQSGQPVAALAEISRALEIAPEEASFWCIKANIEASTGECAAALQSYDRAIALDDALAHVWFNKGSYLDDIGRHEEAVECLTRAIQIDPHDSNVWDNLGVVHLNLGNREDALACFEQAIEVNPQNAMAYVNVANLLTGLAPYETSSFERAAECAATALNLGGESPVTWCAYARAYDGLGNDEEAVRGYERFLRQAAPSMAEQVGWARARLGVINGDQTEEQFAEKWRKP